MNSQLLSPVVHNKADLPYVDWSDKDLLFADFSDANLEGANLKGAKLEGVSFFFANLKNADLRDADLSASDLEGANLEKANLSGANLSHANLADANLSGANLQAATLQCTDLLGVSLHDANLKDVNFGWPIDRQAVIDALIQQVKRVESYPEIDWSILGLFVLGVAGEFVGDPALGEAVIRSLFPEFDTQVLYQQDVNAVIQEVQKLCVKS